MMVLRNVHFTQVQRAAVARPQLRGQAPQWVVDGADGAGGERGDFLKTLLSVKNNVPLVIDLDCALPYL